MLFSSIITIGRIIHADFNFLTPKGQRTLIFGHFRFDSGTLFVKLDNTLGKFFHNEKYFILPGNASACQIIPNRMLTFS